MEDSIDFNDFRAVQNICKNDNQRASYSKNGNNFQKSIENLKNKMNILLNNNQKYNNDNIIQKVLDDNLYVFPKFKSKKYENSQKRKIDKKYFIKSSSNQNLFHYENNDITQNNDIAFNTGENLIDNSNERTNLCINVQNIYIQDKQKRYPNLDEISGRINLPNNLSENQMLYNNINSSISPFINSNNNLLGNKRSSGKVGAESEKEKLYKEIKALCDKYKNNDKVGIKIYEVESGFFEKNETLIIEKPVCIIYFNRKLINKIYLIREKNMIEDDKEIIEILNEVKLKLDNYIKKTIV